MKTVKAKVIKEVYRVYPEGVKAHNAHTKNGEHIPYTPAKFIDFESPNKAIREAMKIFLADENSQHVMVDRVIIHEPVINNTWLTSETVSEQVTGSWTLNIPQLVRGDSNFSRYNPVNGWVVPKEIDVEVYE